MPGTFLRICVAPDNLVEECKRRPRWAVANAAPGGRGVPERAKWYAAPSKVFDTLYLVGARVHSAWALNTSAGLILIDTLFGYAVEPEIVDGLTVLGFESRRLNKW